MKKLSEGVLNAFDAQAKTFPYVYGDDVWSNYPGVTVRLERIYPETAKEMLKCNVRNRPMKRQTIDMAINNGEWSLNGATIVFDDNGMLLDGQNRLENIVKSGKPIDTLVVRGVKSHSQFTMDSGVKRSLGDHIAMLGYKDSSKLGQATQRMMLYNEYGLESSLASRGLKNYTTIPSALQYFVEHDEDIIALKKRAHNVESKYHGLSFGTVIVLMLDIEKDNEPEDVKSFFDQIRGIEPPCPVVLKLKQKLVDNGQKISRGKEGASDKKLAAYFVKAWNAFLRGDDDVSLVYKAGGSKKSQSPFPKVLHKQDVE